MTAKIAQAAVTTFNQKKNCWRLSLVFLVFLFIIYCGCLKNVVYTLSATYVWWHPNTLTSALRFTSTKNLSLVQLLLYDFCINIWNLTILVFKHLSIRHCVHLNTYKSLQLHYTCRYKQELSVCLTFFQFIRVTVGTKANHKQYECISIFFNQRLKSSTLGKRVLQALSQYLSHSSI